MGSGLQSREVADVAEPIDDVGLDLIDKGGDRKKGA